jgi:septation ring formation regulator EzrA
MNEGNKLPGSNNETDNWEQWSKHILKELERLNVNYEKIQKELADVKEELAVIKNQQTTVGELKQWKKDVDEVMSASQLKELRQEVDSLLTFRTVAITVWAVIQVISGIIFALLSRSVH